MLFKHKNSNSSRHEKAPSEKLRANQRRRLADFYAGAVIVGSAELEGIIECKRNVIDVSGCADVLVQVTLYVAHAFEQGNGPELIALSVGVEHLYAFADNLIAPCSDRT